MDVRYLRALCVALGYGVAKQLGSETEKNWVGMIFGPTDGGTDSSGTGFWEAV